MLPNPQMWAECRILEKMSSSSRSPRRHLASSPFKPRPEQVVEIYEVGDRVSHDLHGLGRVVAVDPSGVTVDFGSKSLRLPTPFPKMEKI